MFYQSLNFPGKLCLKGFFLYPSAEGSNQPFDIIQSEAGLGFPYWPLQVRGQDVSNWNYLCGPMGMAGLWCITRGESRSFVIREVMFRAGM